MQDHDEPQAERLRPGDSPLEHRRAWLLYCLAGGTSPDTGADAYFDGLSRRVAAALLVGCGDGLDQDAQVVARAWVGSIRYHVRHCVDATQWELHREGAEGFGRESGLAALGEVFGRYGILTLPGVTREAKALQAERRAVRRLWEWVAAHGEVTGRGVARAVYRYRGPGGMRRAEADLRALADAGLVEAVVRRGRRGPAVEAYRVAAPFVAGTDGRETALKAWILSRKSRGDVRRRKGIYYARALADARDMLQFVGLPRARAEAVGAAWHGGFCQLAGVIAVLSPLRRCAVGRDPRDELRRAVEEHLRPYRGLLEADDTEEDLVLEFLDLSLAVMLERRP